MELITMCMVIESVAACAHIEGTVSPKFLIGLHMLFSTLNHVCLVWLTEQKMAVKTWLMEENVALIFG
jgi:hypothetical protein